MKIYPLLFASLFFSLTASSQYIFEMVKDINPTGDGEPYRINVFNNQLFFSAGESTYGNELYSSNGTEAGTNVFKDIVTGVGSSYPAITLISGNKLYFLSSATGDVEPWVTDGTPNGTQLLKDINPSSGSLTIGSPWLDFNGTAYFVANDGTNGSEIWMSDGTTAGTQLLKNINPSGNSAITDLVKFGNDKFVFRADDGTNGNELWISDGTSAGTVMLKDINTTPGGSSHSHGFIEYNNKIYFTADDGTNGAELWVTDGTTGGTILLKDINSSGSSSPFWYYVHDNKLYFTATEDTYGTELWVTDGTTGGTVLLKDINPSGNGFPGVYASYNGKLYFQANDGVSGYELWVSDGTTNGTTLLADLATGGLHASPSNFVIYKNKLYFRATDGLGYKLWRTDGTALGTEIVEPPISTNDSPAQGSAGEMVVYNGSFYLKAEYNTNGRELWKLTDTTTSAGSLENELVFKASFYPNPTSECINIKTNYIGKQNIITVYNLQGQVVLSKEIISTTNNIDLNALESGLYLFELKCDQYIFKDKIFKH